MRAGAYALSLLSVPLNVHVLRALEEEPLPLVDLRCVTGEPSQTTMRAYLRTLTELGVLSRQREVAFPGSVAYELGPAGCDLLGVAGVLQRWLANAPGGSIALGSPAAKGHVKALVDGWSASMIRALAARPLSLTELNRLISGLNYPSLERRLSAMRLAGQVEGRSEKGRGTPYAVSPWLREATAPLLTSGRWERRRAHERCPAVGRIDVEALLLLALPLLEVDDEISGVCRLAVQLGGSGSESALAGVVAGLVDGRVVSCVAKLEEPAEAWAAGSVTAWLGALIEGEADLLEVGGDGSLAMTVLAGLHGALFRLRQPTSITEE